MASRATASIAPTFLPITSRLTEHYGCPDYFVKPQQYTEDICRQGGHRYGHTVLHCQESAQACSNASDSLHVADFRLRCPFPVHRHPARLRPAETDLRHTCCLWHAVPHCHLPQSRRSSALARLVHPWPALQRPAHLTAHHHHGAWQSHQSRG